MGRRSVQVNGEADSGVGGRRNRAPPTPITVRSRRTPLAGFTRKISASFVACSGRCRWRGRQRDRGGSAEWWNRSRCSSPRRRPTPRSNVTAGCDPDRVLASCPRWTETGCAENAKAAPWLGTAHAPGTSIGRSPPIAEARRGGPPPIDGSPVPHATRRAPLAAGRGAFTGAGAVSAAQRAAGRTGWIRAGRTQRRWGEASVQRTASVSSSSDSEPSEACLIESLILPRSSTLMTTTSTSSPTFTTSVTLST